MQCKIHHQCSFYQHEKLMCWHVCWVKGYCFQKEHKKQRKQAQIIKNFFFCFFTISIFFSELIRFRKNDQTQYYEHWGVKWITRIISSSWHLQWVGYIREQEHFVVKVYMLKGSKKCKYTDTDVFDKGQTATTRQLGLNISKLQLLCGIPSLQQLVSIKSGPRKKHWWTSHCTILTDSQDTWRTKAGLCGSIQTSYCSSNCWKG